MESSPLQFARDFERLKSDIARSPSPENALLRLVAFWQNLKERAALDAYRTYLEEYLQLLSSLLNEKNLTDMTIEELSVIGKFVKELPAGQIPSPYQEAVAQYRTLSAQSYARKLLYVGDYEEALAALGVENSQALAPEEADGKNETEILRALCQRAVEKASPACGFLRSVLAELEFAKDDLHQNRVNCLFVEKESDGNSTRGRLRVMEGNIRQSEADSPSHEVTFEGQIKTPDDPFVGVAYDALDALKALFRSRGEKAKAETPYHAHFSIQESGHHFTGDSIGLAFALLSYAQAVKSDVTRHERLLPGDIAVTGSIDKAGRVLPVNNETLKLKIERAFFSPVRYLVLPEENHRAAVEILKEFQTRHPRRQLRLIAAGRLGETIDDRNIIRAEKVCMGEYITRVTLRTTRRAKVQVPILLALIYLLVCLIYPKAWIWFDWKIDHIEVIDRRFRAVNEDGHTIFTSDEHPFRLDERAYSTERKETRYLSLDADNDNRDELFFIPFGRESWVVTSTLQYYENDGTLKWSKPAYEPTSYPGDSDVKNIDKSLNYLPLTLIPINNSRGEHFVMPVSVASMPARCQFVLFDTAGNKISGPYLHTGHMANNAYLFEPGIGGREGRLMVSCANNRMDRAGLIVIDPFRLEGVSPPYDDELFLLSGAPRGNQFYYIGFPETEISAGSSNRNVIVSIKRNGTEYLVDVQEGSNEFLNRHFAAAKDTMLLPNVNYILDTNFIPKRAYFPDRGLDRFQSCLSAMGKEPLTGPQELLQNLLNDVIVYRGDSIVYHPKAGIHPTSKE